VCGTENMKNMAIVVSYLLLSADNESALFRVARIIVVIDNLYPQATFNKCCNSVNNITLHFNQIKFITRRTSQSES
jgi:hypothetical protein